MGLKISVKDLHKSFESKHVLKGLSVEINSGESFVILGGSGAGKSVFLKHLAGLIEQNSGIIQFNGHNINRITQYEKAALMDKVGVLFQEIGLFDYMTVWENVAFHYLQVKRMNKKRALELAIQHLKDVGVNQLSTHIYPPQTSMGMQKRIGLARVLARSPDLILLDEPTSGLDPILSQRIGNLVASRISMSKATSITITHDVQLAKTIADRIGLLHNGVFVWIGTQKEFITTQEPAVKQFITGSIDGPLEISDI